MVSHSAKSTTTTRNVEIMESGDILCLHKDIKK